MSSKKGKLLPEIPTFAFFDTAFHATLRQEAFSYALPYELAEKYVLGRYGFHGTSRRYVSGLPLHHLSCEAPGSRFISCNLGNGSSICALRGGDGRFAIALEVSAYHARKYIGAYAAALGYLDAVAFTGGIGQHVPLTWKRICRGLDFLGLRLEQAANLGAAGHQREQFGQSNAPVSAWVIPVDEELQIAREVNDKIGLCST